jgi:hypothetical protein
MGGTSVRSAKAVYLTVGGIGGWCGTREFGATVNQLGRPPQPANPTGAVPPPRSVPCDCRQALPFSPLPPRTQSAAIEPSSPLLSSLHQQPAGEQISTASHDICFCSILQPSFDVVIELPFSLVTRPRPQRSRSVSHVFRLRLRTFPWRGSICYHNAQRPRGYCLGYIDSVCNFLAFGLLPAMLYEAQVFWS